MFRVELRKKLFWWYWRLVSEGNGEVLATSETYSSRAKAVQTANMVARRLGVQVLEKPRPE